jgi:lipopolysaccharide export system permease protein
MLFDSSLRKELERGVLGTLLVLVTVVLTMILIRMLGLAAKGNVAVTDVSLLMGYTMIGQLPTLLTLALFIAVVSLLNRLYRDSEMLVWQASGVRLLRMLRPLWQMSWPILLILLGLTFWARPWAQQQMDVLRLRFEQRSDIARIAPGQFQTSADGRRVFFIDSHSDAERVGKNVFIVMTEKNHEAVVNASEGVVEVVNGLRYLNLHNGERVETHDITGERSRSQFDNARILLGEAPLPDASPQRSKSKTTLALLGSPAREDQGEMAWRMGSVWCCLNLVLIGLASASPQVRRANAWRLVWALLAFIAYFNVLSLSQNWVATGKLSMFGALAGIHGTIMVATLALLWWRDGSWRRLSGSASGLPPTAAESTS